VNATLVKKLLNISSPILITGASGTGKSFLAKKIFNLSTINQEKFLIVHLASLKEDLLESELFGHRRGSFTGAIENKNGYLKDVGSGTLFLDEIGELSLEAQKKLLYLLEEKKYTPIGSTAALNFDGRLIMATNRDLQVMVNEGKFREDLYFRLSLFHIELESIAIDKIKLHKDILRNFETYKNEYKKTSLQMSPEVLTLLLSSPWRGNYRELKNCLHYMVALSEDNILYKKDFPIGFLTKQSLRTATNEENFIAQFPTEYGKALENFEEWYLKGMLERFSGKINETARTLGMSKTTLINKARKYKIDTLLIRAKANTQNTCDKAA
jgi:DNA-binding NtrC family response regulator